MEYERKGDLRSEGKRECLVLGSQESSLGELESGIGIGPRITDNLRSKKQEVVLFLISTA